MLCFFLLIMKKCEVSLLDLNFTFFIKEFMVFPTVCINRLLDAIWI